MSFGFGFGLPGGASTAGGPSLSLQFVGSTALSPLVTFTRGSQAMLFDSTGTLAWAPNNVIRNNTMVGAVAGTPGTLPTNWGFSGTLGTLTREIVGVGTVNGIAYIDIRWSGTTSSTNTGVSFETNGSVAASNGQTWSSSVFIAVVSGSLTNISPALQTRGLDGTNTVVQFINQSITPTATLTRLSQLGTLSNATIVSINAGVNLGFSSGVAIDITLRIGMPQLERGSVATAVNATSGTAYYGPRFDYDPSTLAARGLLIEEQRTNSIRNNTMQGAVAGTPGTLPTNWIFSAGGTSTQVVGTGTENGVSYIDLRIFGTTTADGGLQYEANTQIAAVSGQTWSLSHFVKVLAGSVSFIRHRIIERAAAGTYLQEGNSLFTPASSVSLLAASRFSYAYTTANASTAFVVPGLLFNWGVGTSVDFTLRIGLPQLEQGAFATSVIPTTGSAATRNADSASITGANFSSWYNATEGTLFAEWSSLTSSVARVFTVNDNTQNNAISLVHSGTAYGGDIYVSNVFQGVVGPTTAITPNVIVKHAVGYLLNNSNTTANGVNGTNDTSVSIPTVTQALIGAGRTGAAHNGHIRRIAYYPRRLSNTELQAITA